MAPLSLSLFLRHTVSSSFPIRSVSNRLGMNSLTPRRRTKKRGHTCVCRNPQFFFVRLVFTSMCIYPVSVLREKKRCTPQHIVSLLLAAAQRRYNHLPILPPSLSTFPHKSKSRLGGWTETSIFCVTCQHRTLFFFSDSFTQHKKCFRELLSPTRSIPNFFIHSIDPIRTQNTSLYKPLASFVYLTEKTCFPSLDTGLLRAATTNAGLTRYCSTTV